jgi:cobalt-zinc-cadmium efflux system outer membrane protein
MSIFRGFGTHPSKYINFVYVCVSLVLPAIAAAQSLDTRGTVAVGLDQAVVLALDHSLELASIRARSDAIRAASSYAGALPDPTLSLQAMNMPTDTFRLDQEPMTQMQVAISQSFPFPGKRKLRSEAVDHQASASDQMETERRSVIAGEVRIAWWQLMSLDKALKIVEQNKDLMRNFVQIAQTKYKVGNGLQQDVLLAQLELSRLLDREMKLQGMRRASRARLNGLMNRPPDGVLDLPNRPKNTELPELPSERQLLQQAETGRALIDVHRDLVASANASLELARKDRWPDFKLGVGYGFRQGYDPMRNTNRSDLLSVMLSINVPLYSRSKQMSKENMKYPVKPWSCGIPCAASKSQFPRISQTIYLLATRSCCWTRRLFPRRSRPFPRC